MSIFSLRSLGFKPAVDPASVQTAPGRERLQESIERALAWTEANAELLRNPMAKNMDTFGSLNSRSRNFLGEQIAELRGSLSRGDSKSCAAALRELSERAILAGTSEGLRMYLAADAQVSGLALIAIARDEPQLLRMLLKKGANPDEPGPMGQSLARIAILRLQSESLRMLIEHKAALTPDERGGAVHWLAGIWHRPEIAPSLANLQEHPERKDSRYERASECLAVLKKSEQPLNSLNAELRTPLALALAGLIEPRELDVWLDAGALLSGVEGQSLSPLEAFVSAKWRPMPIFEELAESLNAREADFMAIGPSGQSAFDLATPPMQRILEAL